MRQQRLYSEQEFKTFGSRDSQAMQMLTASRFAINKRVECCTPARCERIRKQLSQGVSRSPSNLLADVRWSFPGRLQ
jgi:hypothetical protein